MEFKKLEIEQEKNWVKRITNNSHLRKSILSILIGAVASFAFYYFTEGMHLDAMPNKEIVQSLIVGAFIGFFLTNSPCARGKC